MESIQYKFNSEKESGIRTFNGKGDLYSCNLYSRESDIINFFEEYTAKLDRLVINGLLPRFDLMPRV